MLWIFAYEDRKGGPPACLTSWLWHAHCPALRIFAGEDHRMGPCLFDARERAALALTEQVTRLGEHGVSDQTWAEVRACWSEEETANLIVAIATINVWNRLAVTTRVPPPPADPGR